MMFASNGFVSFPDSFILSTLPSLPLQSSMHPNLIAHGMAIPTHGKYHDQMYGFGPVLLCGANRHYSLLDPAVSNIPGMPTSPPHTNTYLNSMISFA
jgi:hypothetical protein